MKHIKEYKEFLNEAKRLSFKDAGITNTMDLSNAMDTLRDSGIDWDQKGQAFMFVSSKEHTDAIKALGLDEYKESLTELRSDMISGTSGRRIDSLEDRKYELKKDAKGATIGSFSNVTLPKGTIIYNLPGGVFADHFSLKNKYASRSSQGPRYFDKPTFKGIMIKQTPALLSYIEKNSKVLESVNEAKDNLYLQLHKKYADQIKGLKAKKIKKLTDLVSVQRWAMEDVHDTPGHDHKKMSAVFNNERKLFKQYMAGDHSVMLPESLTEANRGKVFKAARKGSYPAVIVVVQDGKVIHQEPVSTPDIAPATFNVMQEKYPKALLHLEDKTGKRLFSESKISLS